MSLNPFGGLRSLFATRSISSFTKVEKADFYPVMTPVIELISRLQSPEAKELSKKFGRAEFYSHETFIFPIRGTSEIYFRDATLKELRSYCLSILDTLPENEDTIIRAFLVGSENGFKESAASKRTAIQPAFQAYNPL